MNEKILKHNIPTVVMNIGFLKMFSCGGKSSFSINNIVAHTINTNVSNMIKFVGYVFKSCIKTELTIENKIATVNTIGIDFLCQPSSKFL